MGTQLERLAAYKAAVADQNPTAPIRIRLSSSDALALITETGTASLRHPDAAEQAVTALSAALAIPAPDKTDIGGLVAWAKSVDKAQSDFWDAIHGEEINGVEILRKQS
jgi:hypothetical protein